MRFEDHELTEGELAILGPRDLSDKDPRRDRGAAMEFVYKRNHAKFDISQISLQ